MRVRTARFAGAKRTTYNSSIHLLAIRGRGHSLTTLSSNLNSNVGTGILTAVAAAVTLHFVRDGVSLVRSVRVVVSSLPIYRMHGVDCSAFALFSCHGNNGNEVIRVNGPTCIRLHGARRMGPM